MKALKLHAESRKGTKRGKGRALGPDWRVKCVLQGVDICVGTLQKMMQFVRSGKLDLSQVKFLVLDEADDLQKKDDRKDGRGERAGGETP
eukprot:3121157-Amphidinium_carterae.1